MIHKKVLIVVGIIIASMVVVITLATTSIYYLTFPKAAHDLQSGLIKDRKTYLQKLYGLGDSGYKSSVMNSVDDQSNARWHPSTAMLTRRASGAAASLNGKIYVMGGTELHGKIITAPSGTMEVYDPVTNKWSSVASMATPRDSLAAVTLNGKIYVLGGTGISYNNLSSVEMYDPVTNKWSAVASTSTARVSSTAVTLNGKIYVMGGDAIIRWKTLNTVEVYDPVTNKWSSTASMITSRSGAVAAVLNGKIYVMGGTNVQGKVQVVMSTVEMYDPVTNKWSAVASMSTKRQIASTAVLNGKIYVMGGLNDDGAYLSSVEMYDPVTNKWSTVASTSTARVSSTAASLNDKIYVMGGAADGGLTLLNSVEVYPTPTPTYVCSSSGCQPDNHPPGKGTDRVFRFSNLQACQRQCLKPGPSPGPPPEVIIQDKNLDWLWDTAPKSMLDKIPIAENLSFVWPPPKGSRYRLTAFPYPDTGDSSLWEVRFAKGMSSLLDNTAGQITFPGWQISIYDPAEPNYNTWQHFLTKNFSSNQKISGISSNAMYVEVTHACYAPPKRTYPTCDDGGYWLYGTVGSGVFWKTCGTQGSNKPGKYLVCNNKIDAMFKLWNYAQTQANPPLKTMMMVAGLDPAKLKTTKAEDYLYARLNGTGGGYNLMAALKSIIDASEAGRQIPKLTAWRGMEPSKAKKGWVTWLACTITFVVILLALLGGVGYSIYSAVKKRDHQKWWVSTLIVLGTVVGTFLMYKILYSLEWSVVSEYMFDKFGYTTMDSALKKSGLDLKSFIFATAGIDKNYQNLPPGHYNAVANGLAQTQLFDFDLSYLTSMCGLDSVIMHTQPNKSGSWAVEILDVRNTPAAGAKSLNDLIKTLGLCGQPLDGTARMPPLMQGPIKPSTNYVGYQPTALCHCDEQAVEKLYNKGAGTLKKCVFCKGSLSEEVC